MCLITKISVSGSPRLGLWVILMTCWPSASAGNIHTSFQGSRVARYLSLLTVTVRIIRNTPVTVFSNHYIKRELQWLANRWFICSCFHIYSTFSVIFNKLKVENSPSALFCFSWSRVEYVIFFSFKSKKIFGNITLCFCMLRFHIIFLPFYYFIDQKRLCTFFNLDYLIICLHLIMS